MTSYTFEHIHLRSPDPDATADWFGRMFGAEVIRSTVAGTPRVDVRLGGDALYGTGYVQAPDASMQAVDSVSNTADLDPDGLPAAGTWQVGDLALTIEPIAFSPVLLTAPDGRTSRFPRAWCRFTAQDGRTGQGWTEWNQPQTHT